MTAVSADFLTGETKPLAKRGITQETCEKWGYHIATRGGEKVQVANYYHDNQLVGQKVRTSGKDFSIIGSLKEAGLYGQWLWRDGGRKVVVTEGEIDALTVSQLQGNKWPVVSLPGGAAGARKAVQKSLEWLEGYEEVVFMFDMDEPGQKAAQECAELFSPGKAKIARLPLKDPNEMLQAGRGQEVITAMWDAKSYRPDGILQGSEMYERVMDETTVAAIPYPWHALNTKTLGLRRGELVTVTAGSGTGKSLFAKEIGHHLLGMGETVGFIMLEESARTTALSLMSVELSKPLHLGREGLSKEDIDAAFQRTLGTGRAYLYDHFGSTEIENLLSKIRYLARGCDCGWIILDHLSIVLSGLHIDDERKAIDMTMTKLRTLVEETGIGLILVSHLKRPEGKGHEEGTKVSLAHLRGSHSIAQLSDMVLALERDQQAEAGNETIVRVLKNRFSGTTGPACVLTYIPETGRLVPTDTAVPQDF